MPRGIAFLSGGQWRVAGWREAPSEEPPDPEDPPPDPGGMPTRASILAGAGLSNPGALTPASGLIQVTTPGAVVQNLDLAGSLFVKANNVTVRNCRLRGFWTSFGLRLDPVTGTVIEDCEVEGQTNPLNPDEGSNSLVGAPNGATLTTIRRCFIHGSGEPIKIDSGVNSSQRSLYELNRIEPTIPEPDPLHLDGMQASGKKHVMIRHNVIETSAKVDKANSCILIQGWSNPNNVQTEDVRIIQNYLTGGNFTVFMIGGKSVPGASDPRYSASNPQWFYTYIRDCSFIGNRITGTIGTETDTRFGWFRSTRYAGDQMVISDNYVNGVLTPL